MGNVVIHFFMIYNSPIRVLGYFKLGLRKEGGVDITKQSKKIHPSPRRNNTSTLKFCISLEVEGEAVNYIA